MSNNLPKDYRKGIPGVSEAALNAIGDENTRSVLRSILDGWNVRNGSSGTGDARFVTASELSEVRGIIGGLSSSLGSVIDATTGPGALTPGKINQIITDLQADVINSALFQELGTRIRLIDDKYSLEVLGLQTELDQIVDGTTDITVVTAGGTTSIRAIKDTVYDPSTGVAASSAMIGQINTISLTSDSANARSLAGVRATVYDPDTGLAKANAAIIALNDVSATSDSANARYLFSVNAQVGLKNRVFYQTSPPTSTTSYTLRTNDIWFDSDDKNRAYRWDGSAWLETSDGRIADAAAAVASEAGTRVNQDNALAYAINTIWAAVGDSSSLVQTGATGVANNAGAVAERWNQTQAAIKDSSGNYISSAAVREETQAVATKAGTLEAKYTVKVDVNGYVSGFGLASTANNSTPFSEFLIRADRFAVGNPATPGTTTSWNGLASIQDGVLWVQTLYSGSLKIGSSVTATGLETGVYVTGFLAGGGGQGTYTVNTVTDLSARSMNGSYITPSGVVPFIVTTTTTTRPDGQTVPPGVYMDSAFVKTLIGTYIEAGYFRAGNIYIGNGGGYLSSKYIDNQSNLQMHAVALATWDGAGITLAPTIIEDENGNPDLTASAPSLNQVYTSTNFAIVGPDFHAAYPVKQRVRNTNNGVLVPIFVSFQARVDHYMTLWYRVIYTNGATGPWYQAGAPVTEQASDYGSVAITWGANFGISNNEGIQFGVSVTFGQTGVWNWSKASIYDFFGVVQAVNV